MAQRPRITEIDEKFGAVLDAAPDGMVIADENGIICIANIRAEQMFGYGRDELQGSSIEMLVPERYRRTHVSHRAGYFRNPKLRPMGAGLELFGRRKDGTEFPVEISLSPLQTDNRTFAISAIRDISDRKRAEAQFRALLECAPDAMVIVNDSGEIVLVNAQTERLFGYSRQELLGRPVEMLVPNRYRDVHTSHRAAYFGSAQPRPMGVGLELFGRRRNGAEFPVEISLSPLETDEGVLVASAIRDITERKVAEAERVRLLQERAAHAEANRIKDEFLATLSHEMRTPLNAVLGWLDLIRGGAVPGGDMERALATIHRNAKAQAQLVDDLLDVSRIVSGKLRLQTGPLDLTEIADAAIDVVHPAAEAKRIKLETHYAARPVFVVADPDRMQQVIWNLLSNAVKFTSPNGRVQLEIRIVRSQVQVTVRDTGQGIPSALLPHVFDRFRQADSSTTRPQGGLGLGLAIARSIIELHGGTISVASSGEGMGATFRVHLPVLPFEERRKHRPSHIKLDALRGIRVLVVDDQEDERTLLAAIFQTQVAEVRAADSVGAAFALLESWKPDLIVSDLAMPQEDGYALIRRLRGSSGLNSIRAVAVTAHARPEDRDAALAAGFNAYVAKPVNRDALLTRAAALLAADEPAEW